MRQRLLRYKRFLFPLPEVQCAPNRLIQVPCVATGSSKFCAGTFSFQFDKNLLEIRKVTPYKGAKAVFHQADTLKISYVHPDGIDLSAAPEIITLQFKVKGEGTTQISFEVYDCVDSDVEFMQIGTCISGNVTAENGSKPPAARPLNRRENKPAAHSPPHGPVQKAAAPPNHRPPAKRRRKQPDRRCRLPRKNTTATEIKRLPLPCLQCLLSAV